MDSGLRRLGRNSTIETWMRCIISNNDSRRKEGSRPVVLYFAQVKLGQNSVLNILALAIVGRMSLTVQRDFVA